MTEPVFLELSQLDLICAWSMEQEAYIKVGQVSARQTTSLPHRGCRCSASSRSFTIAFITVHIRVNMSGVSREILSKNANCVPPSAVLCPVLPFRVQMRAAFVNYGELRYSHGPAFVPPPPDPPHGPIDDAIAKAANATGVRLSTSVPCTESPIDKS